jgi:hypothetical protein
MRMQLEIPVGWSTSRRDGWTLAASPDGLLRVESSPLFTLPFVPRPAIERAVEASMTVEYTQVAEGLLTQHGWPYTVFSLRVLEGQREHHRRLSAVYSVLRRVGVVTCLVDLATAPVRVRETTRELFVSARPRFSMPEPAAIADLFRARAS